MSINRPIKKLIAVVLAAGAVALAGQIAAAPVAAGASGPGSRIGLTVDAGKPEPRR